MSVADEKMRPGSGPLRSVASEAGLVCLFFVGFAVLFFYDVVFLGKTLRASNTISTTLPEGHFNYDGGPPRSMAVYDNTPAVLEEPYQRFKDRALREGIFPLWNPYQAGGYPFLATLESSLLFIPELILYVVPSAYAWDVYLLFRLVLAGLFTYVFMRVLGFDVLPSIAAGTSYMFSGPLISWVTNVTLNADILLPLFLSLVELMLRSPRKRYVVLTSVVIFQSIAGGHPEHAFFLLLTGSIYLIARLLGRANRYPIQNVGKNAAIAFAGGFGLAAVLLLPFVEYALFNAWHIHAENVGLIAEGVKNAVTIIFPWYYSSELVSYTGWTYNTWPGGWLGFVPVWLMVSAAVAKKRHSVGAVFVGLLGFYLLKMYGFPLVNWIGALPVFNMVRLPLHITQNIAFAGAVLCGMGVASLSSDPRNLTRFMVAAVPLLAVAMIVVLVHPPPNDPWVVFGLPAAILAGLSASFLICRRAPWGPRAFAFVVTGALFIELFLLIPRERSVRDEPFQAPPYVQFLKEHQGSSRVYGLGGVLAPNTATAFGIYDVAMYEGLFVKRFADYIRELVDAGFFNEGSFHAFRGSIRDPSNRFLDLLGVKYLIAPGGTVVREDHMTRLSLKSVYDGEAVIYERLNVFPRAMIRHRADVVPDDGRALALLRTGYDISGRVLLDKLPAHADLSAGPLEDASRVEAMHDAINSKTFQVNMEHDGLLVVNDVSYPGWKAEVDGKGADLLTANYLFQAVFVPAGQHTVRFDFRPASFVVGLLISVCSVVLLGVFALISTGESRQSNRNFKSSTVPERARRMRNSGE